MARKQRGVGKNAAPEPVVLLDCQGLSLLIEGHADMVGYSKAWQKHGWRPVVSALTLVEAHHSRLKPDRVNYALSHLTVHDVTRAIATQATRLLHENNLHGHRHAIDAVVAATALSLSCPVVVVTSDPDDMSTLCGESVRIFSV